MSIPKQLMHKVIHANTIRVTCSTSIAQALCQYIESLEEITFGTIQNPNPVKSNNRYYASYLYHTTYCRILIVKAKGIDYKPIIDTELNIIHALVQNRLTVEKLNHD